MAPDPLCFSESRPDRQAIIDTTPCPRCGAPAGVYCDPPLPDGTRRTTVPSLGVICAARIEASRSS